MNRALIGHTGFVGSNLFRQIAFDATFNSSNIQDLANGRFDEVWCAGIQAVKWWANKNPEEDWNGIQSLLDVLASVRTGRFVLISTVDVFRQPTAVDEDTPVEVSDLHTYGQHRYQVEEWVRAHFETNIVVRLPGLFGEGLRKNVIYDFLHDNQLAMIHADAIFQFYNLERLAGDIETAVKAERPLIHLTTEPVSVRSVAKTAFGIEFDNRPTPSAPRYDFRTRYAELWGRDIPYLESADEVLSGISAFVARQKAK